MIAKSANGGYTVTKKTKLKAWNEQEAMMSRAKW